MSDHWQPVTLDDPEPAPLTAWEPRKWKVGDRVRVRRPAECRFVMNSFTRGATRGQIGMV